MAGTLFTSSQKDSDGRQFLLTDNVKDVHYYSTIGETWDKTGSASQSWHLEKFLPNDSFDTDAVASDRWKIVDTPATSTSTITQANGKILLGIEGDEGTVSLSSEGKWKLTGDFELRLYFDWTDYYNEYRSITYTFLKVAVDNENATRVSFAFDGDSFNFVSEKVVDTDLRFFDWQKNGSQLDQDITSAKAKDYIQLKRENGVIQAYVVDGSDSTAIGDPVSESVFSEDVFVEFGIENKTFNTYRSSFTKFFAVEATLNPVLTFFSPSRGERQDFPDRVILTVDDLSLSIIDEDQSRLWMRFLFGEDNPIPNSTTKVYGCNGVVYCTTSDGLIAFDFHRDKILKYKDSSIFAADENLALRNAGVVFNSFISDVGTIPDNNIHDVACRTIGADDYLAFTNDSGVVVMRALASGVALNGQGPLPGSHVEISEKGALYWAGFNSSNNDGELSFFSNITALTSSGTLNFTRTDFYGIDTPINIFGSNITAFDVRTVTGVDITAVGTTEGLTFLAFSPAAPFTKSVSYGVSSPADNPVVDPSFENYLGLDWKPFVDVCKHEDFTIMRSTSFPGDGTNSLLLRYNDITANGFYEANSAVGVYQDVDMTGLERIYFDSQLTIDPSATANMWNFEVLVGDVVVKSYQDQDGDFTKFNDSANVTGYKGVHRLKFQIRVVEDSNPVFISSRQFFLDNIRTKIGDPDFRVLPPGNASIREVLLQYDGQGHKIYFSTAEGYGAVDLDDNSLDYFIPLSTFGPDDTEVLSSDFSRIENEV